MFVGKSASNVTFIWFRDVYLHKFMKIFPKDRADL